MKIPFFNKKVKVDVTVTPNTTQLGLVEGKPITQETFKKVETEFNKFFSDRVERNKKIYEDKIAVAKEWVEFVKYLIRFIPKENISCIAIKDEPTNDLESIVAPRVYLAMEFISSPERSSYRQYEIFAKEHDSSEKSINDILSDVKNFMKEIASKDTK